MPIINLQRSVHQVGRIRLGEQTASGNGKARPTKLSTFRLTSPQRQPIAAAAGIYGGQVHPFENDRSDDRWQVVTDTDAIPVVIPPTHHLDQWMEAWTNGGCDRRCDGQTMTVHKGQAVDQACMCDPDNRVCKITTRLWVVLPELEALGVWRLESHGYYAAAELAGAADLCAAVTAQGRAVPARLHLEQRTRRTGGQTFKFAVPVLSVDVSLPQAKAILGQADITTGEITPPTTRQIEPPAPRAIEPPAPQPAAQSELPPPPPADIPAPRTADQYHADNEHDEPDPYDIDQGDGCITEGQRLALLTVFAQIENGDDRKHVKHAFVETFGSPDQLLSEQYDKALSWAQQAVDAAHAKHEQPAVVEVVDQPKLIATAPEPDHTPVIANGAKAPSAAAKKKALALIGKLVASPFHPDINDSEAYRDIAVSNATAGRTTSIREITSTELDHMIGGLEALLEGRA